MTLWEVDIYPAAGQPDVAGRQAAGDAHDLGLDKGISIHAARGYLLQGDLDRAAVDRLALELLSDPVVERTVVAVVGTPELRQPPTTKANGAQQVHVLLKPGVMDPVAQSAQAAIADFGFQADEVRTLRKYWIDGVSEDQLRLLSAKVLANDAIEQVLVGPLCFDRLHVGSPYAFQLVTVPIRELDAAALAKLSRDGQLYLTLVEMETIQRHFCEVGRDPTDVELETIAQTWSEHCSHKTLAGRIAYRDERGERRFQNMLKETIFAATQQIRREWGDRNW